MHQEVSSLFFFFFLRVGVACRRPPEAVGEAGKICLSVVTAAHTISLKLKWAASQNQRCLFWWVLFVSALFWGE